MPRPRPNKVAARVTRVAPNFPIYYNQDAKLSVEDNFLMLQENARNLEDEIRRLRFNERTVLCTTVMEQEKVRAKDKEFMEEERAHAGKCLHRMRQHHLRVLLERERRELDQELRQKGLTIMKDRL